MFLQGANMCSSMWTVTVGDQQEQQQVALCVDKSITEDIFQKDWKQCPPMDGQNAATPEDPDWGSQGVNGVWGCFIEAPRPAGVSPTCPS